MICSIIQPAYLPWLGFFERILRSDVTVILDNVDIDRNSKTKFANHNRIRTPDGWKWLTVPILTRGVESLKLNEIHIDQSTEWHHKHFSAIHHAYSKAPYYSDYLPFLREVYARPWAKLNPLNNEILIWMLEQFDIHTSILYNSDMDMHGEKSMLIRNLCQAVGADTYLSGPFGRDYLDRSIFDNAGIRINYHNFKYTEYTQLHPGFEPCMSAIDLLMNHGTESKVILRKSLKKLGESSKVVTADSTLDFNIPMNGEKEPRKLFGQSICIRADASIRIGSGHIMRCLTLAEELRDAGVNVKFVCRSHAGNLNELIQRKGFQLSELFAVGTAGVTDLNKHSFRGEYASWLGVSQQSDAEETIETLSGTKPDWLIVDHYALDKEWETALRPYVSKIMVIDDLADRRHDCDLLLDQNYFTNGEQRYDDLIPSPCTKLLGPKYALLRKEFSEARKNLRERSGEVKRVLVFLGGSDPENITGIAIEALSDPELLHLQVDVVIGAQNPNRWKIARLVKERSNTKLHVQVGNMAELMSAADLAIGAGGSTTWERCCLGLPSIVIPVAENQMQIAMCIHETGCATVLKGEQVTSAIATAVLHALDQRVREEMCKKALTITDGMGASKVSIYLTHQKDKFLTERKQKNKRFSISFTSDRKSWLNPFIDSFKKELESNGHKITWIHDSNETPEGDFNFILSHSIIIKKNILLKNKHNLVVHESDLPKGKGWSPLSWQILEGSNLIPICLFEANEELDSGSIYLKWNMKFFGNELLDELHLVQGESTIAMCRKFIEEYPNILDLAIPQTGEQTFYKKRTPEDSRLDPNKTIQEQYNLFRIVDNERYPAFFEIDNFRYKLTIEKCK